jgi:subtilisin family serine protease
MITLLVPAARRRRALLIAATQAVAAFYSSLSAQTEAAKFADSTTDLTVVAASSSSPAAVSSEHKYYIVQLADEPAAVVYAREATSRGRGQGLATARGQIAKLQQAQRTLQAALPSAAPNARALYGTQRALNALVVQAPASERAALAALPGVAAVTEFVPHELDASSSIAFLGTPAVWDAAGLNVRGEGVRIGIIDTGIDYRHTDFAGDGTSAGNNPSIVEPGTFPTAKVLGGWDFVGTNYNAGGTPAQQIPAPDPDPLDENGHGTAVAGLAAGFGVNADGSTYTGDYSNATDLNALRISPGLAPKASLYALKVFGASGSTAFTYQAIEWAMDPDGDGDMSDHLDVLNLSLGAANGATEDLTAITLDNAAKLGMVVVASAGNSYDSYYIVGSPSVADGAISVAASLNTEYFLSVQINQPQDYPAFVGTAAAFGPAFDLAGLTSDVVVANPLTGINDNNALLHNADQVAGKLVVMQRGDGIGFTTKVRNAQNSGAVGVIMFNNVPGLPITMGGADPLVTIPSAMIGLAEGQLLVSLIQSGTVNATVSSQPNPSGADLIAAYSSRGPRRGDSFLKPDLTAPAERVITAAVGTGNGTRTFNGTSSSAPHVAGAMALLRQAHPTWSNYELKALAMNTATHDVFSQPYATPPRYGLGRVGAGRIDVAAAARSKVIAYNAARPDLVSLSFGVVDVLNHVNLSREVTVANKGSSDATYTVTYESVTDLPGVKVVFNGSPNLKVPAGKTAKIRLTLQATADDLRNERDPTVAPTQATTSTTSFAARHTLPEEGGYIVLTPTTGSIPLLRVPLHAIIRPVARMQATNKELAMTGDTGQFALNLGGKSLATGPALPRDLLSLVKPLEWQHQSAVNPNATGVRASADLQHVGVTSDFAAVGGELANATLTFGLSTHGSFNTPSAAGTTFRILVDRDRDGLTDVIVYSDARADLSTGTPPSVSNVYTTWFTLINHAVAPATSATFSFQTLYTNGIAPTTATTYLLNNETVTISMPAFYLGLTPNTISGTFSPFGRFNYIVQTLYRNELIDETPVLTYDITAAGVTTAGTATEPSWLLDQPDTTVTLNYQRSAFLANQSLGVLLIRPLNEPGKRTQTIPVKP